MFFTRKPRNTKKNLQKLISLNGILIKNEVIFLKTIVLPIVSQR